MFLLQKKMLKIDSRQKQNNMQRLESSSAVPAQFREIRLTGGELSSGTKFSGLK